MQLADWLDKQGRGARRQLARRLEVSEATISRIAARLQTPSLGLAAAIERETDGAVTAIELAGAA